MARGYMTLGRTVARNVKAIRLEKGMSQQDLADKTGLTVRYISRLENSAPNLTLDVVERLSRGLKCEPSDLLGNSEESSMSGSKEMLDQTIRFLQGMRSRL